MKAHAFKCPKCGFVQLYSYICAETLLVGENAKEGAHRPCPNDGAELLPVFDEKELQ